MSDGECGTFEFRMSNWGRATSERTRASARRARALPMSASGAGRSRQTIAAASKGMTTPVRIATTDRASPAAFMVRLQTRRLATKSIPVPAARSADKPEM